MRVLVYLSHLLDHWKGSWARRSAVSRRLTKRLMTARHLAAAGGYLNCTVVLPLRAFATLQNSLHERVRAWGMRGILPMGAGLVDKERAASNGRLLGLETSI